MPKKFFSLIIFSFLLSACQMQPTPQANTVKTGNTSTSNNYQIEYTNKPTMQNPTATPTATPSTENKKAQGNVAILKTSLGDITVKLFPESAPETVSNFVGLATGTKQWTDPATGKPVTGKSLYSGTIFHRVIEDFMIQGGDPLGKGIGGPGYKFKDEIDPKLSFDKPYLLAMANSGPATNGSQFFITVVETPWLNGKHTIFGEVTSGQDVVDKIVTTKTGPGDKPLVDVVLKSVEIKEK